jgi:hypothetical protein
MSRLESRVVKIIFFYTNLFLGGKETIPTSFLGWCRNDTNLFLGGRETLPPLF